MLVLAVL